MRFVDKTFDIEINDHHGKFVVSLFKRTISREIKRLNKVSNSYKILDIEYEVLYVGWAAVMLAYDGPDDVVLDMLRRVGMYCVCRFINGFFRFLYIII